MKTTKMATKFWVFVGAGLVVIALALLKLSPVMSTGLLALILVSLIGVPLLIAKPQFGPALIGFFLTFERVPSIEVGGISLRINFLLIVLSLVTFIFSKLVKKQLKIRFDPIRTASVVFILLAIVSAAQAVNMSRALTVIVSLALMFCLYLVMSMVIEKKEDLILALKGLLWGALVAGIFGLYQFLGDMAGLSNSLTLLKVGYDSSTFGFARVQAGSYEPLYFANYIFIPAFIIIFLNLSGTIKEAMSRRLSIAIGLLLAINFVLAISRGAYLAAGVALVALAVVQAKKIITLKNFVIVALVGLFVVGGVYLALLKSQPRALEEFIAHITVQDRENGESVVLRLSTSAQAIEFFWEKPILGVGPGNFGPAKEDYPTEAPDGGWPIVNNEYLEIAAEQGLVGIFGFLLLLAIIFAQVIATYRKVKDKLIANVALALGFAFFAILVQYLTFSTLYITHIWYVIGLIGAVANIANHNLSSHAKKSSS